MPLARLILPAPPAEPKTCAWCGSKGAKPFEWPPLCDACRAADASPPPQDELGSEFEEWLASTQSAPGEFDPQAGP